MHNTSLPRTKIDCFTMDALEQIKATLNNQTPSFTHRGGVGKDVRELSDFALQQIKDAVGSNSGGGTGDVATVQSIWVLRALTDSSDEVLYPNIEDESYTKVWEASVPQSIDPNPKSTKAINGFVFDIVDGIDIQANYTIEATIVLCSDTNEPSEENVLTIIDVDNTNRIKEGLPMFTEMRTPTSIQNLSQVGFCISSNVEKVTIYKVEFEGIQYNYLISIEFPLKVDAVAENYDIDVYYYDGTNFTQIQKDPTAFDIDLYGYYDANLENTDSEIVVVLEGDDPAVFGNQICKLGKGECSVKTEWSSFFKIGHYQQTNNNGVTYSMGGYYGSDNIRFGLQMTNAQNQEQ